MKVACFLLAFCVAFIYKADCAITAWSAPAIINKDGNAPWASALAESTTGGAGITVIATGGSTYALISQAPTTGGTFTIDSSGLLSVTTLDYETTTEYDLIIEATATDGDKGTATVTVSISDVEESPAFGATSYTVTIDDLSAAAAELTTLTATDPEGTTIAYTITAGNTNTDFAVGGATGVITVANPLDKSVRPVYALTLTATDTVGSAGTTEVFVYVGSLCSGAVALVSGAIITTMTVLVTRFL